MILCLSSLWDPWIFSPFALCTPHIGRFQDHFNNYIKFASHGDEYCFPQTVIIKWACDYIEDITVLNIYFQINVMK